MPLKRVKPTKARYRIPSTQVRHGLCRSPEYNVWDSMKARCTNSSHPSYEDYGGRGITVCDRWMISFVSFYRDLGPRPSPKHTLDRFPDNNGNYEPGNCRWATRAEQSRNQRRNVWIEYKGETRTLTDWAEVLGISRVTLDFRVRRYRWSIERAFETPVEKRRRVR